MASGCIESIVINGRRFKTDADDSCKITYDGFENEVKPNGDGTMRIVKSRHTGKIEGLNIIMDPSRDDQEFIQEAQDSTDFFDVSATLVDGVVVGGTMQLTEAVATDLKEGTASITLEGTLEKLG